MKRVKNVLLSLSLASLVAAPFAPVGTAGAAAAAKPIVVLVNYQKVNFPGGQNPYIKDGSTMVPVRGVFENMNANVTWTRNNAGQIEVTAKHFDDTVKLTVGSNTATKNGQPVQLERSAENANGRVAVPLRFISEAFGGQVSWVPKSKSANSFDYITIDGQFRYPNKVQDGEMTRHASGYGDPVQVTSFPIVIKHPDKIITIRNITNSYYLWQKPNDSHLNAKARVDNDPMFDGLNQVESGILRIDVEVEALKDNVTVNETVLGKNNFFAVSKMSSGQPVVTAVPYQLKSSVLAPGSFANIMPIKTLNKGEKVSGIVPMEISSPSVQQDFLVRINSNDTLTYSLKIPSVVPGEGK